MTALHVDQGALDAFRAALTTPAWLSDPPDGLWRDPRTGAEIDPHRAAGLSRIFEGLEQKLTGEDSRLVWGLLVDGSYHVLSPPARA